jgi:hypothetical protein
MKSEHKSVDKWYDLCDKSDTITKKKEYTGVGMFEYEWNNPPSPFNPLFNAEEAKKRCINEVIIKKALDEYHKSLKHLNNDDYYDAMDAKENELRMRLNK